MCDAANVPQRDVLGTRFDASIETLRKQTREQIAYYDKDTKALAFTFSRSSFCVYDVSKSYLKSSAMTLRPPFAPITWLRSLNHWPQVIYLRLAFVM